MKSQNHIQKQIIDFLTWHNLMNVTSWTAQTRFREAYYSNILKLAYFSNRN